MSCSDDSHRGVAYVDSNGNATATGTPLHTGLPDGNVISAPSGSGIAPATTSDASIGGMDAASPPSAPQADGGLDAATAALFACNQNSDCVVKTMNTCCGFSERCANVGAVFGAPNCVVGETGMCSFPTIDHCECQASVCVDVQSANQGGQQF